MIIEQLIFVVVAFAIFVYMFITMMRRNDISYIIVLVLEAIGIALNFLEVLFGIKLNVLLMILKYILSIILPLSILIMEHKGKTLAEMSNIIRVKIYMKLGENKKAKKILIELTSEYPENYEGHRLLAEIYEQEGGMRKAIDEYVQAVDLNKQDYDSYYKVAYLLDCLDKKDEASEMLFSLINKKPEYYEASILLGDILIEKEMYKEAANVYQDALKHNQASFEINYNLGIIYTMLNDFQNAKLYYEKAASLNALSYNSKYSLAEIALIYKSLEEAEQKFLEAVEDEELAADAYYELSKICLIKGDKDTAIKYANIAIDLEAKRTVGKIHKDPIFIPIIAKVSIPFNLESRDENEETKKMKKLKPKEIKAKEHLEEMFDKTRHLSYNDIKLLKKYESGKSKKIEQQQNNEIQKERQE